MVISSWEIPLVDCVVKDWQPFPRTLSTKGGGGDTPGFSKRFQDAINCDIPLDSVFNSVSSVMYNTFHVVN